jgi:hypothetical protein
VLRRAGAGLLVWTACAAAPLARVDRWYGSVPANEMDQRLVDFEEAASDTEVLLLGNSHIAFGIDPRIVGPHTFNAAAPSQDLHYDAQYVRTYLSRMRHLRVVVWGLVPWSFGFDLSDLESEGRLCKVYDRYCPRRDGHVPALALHERWNLLRTRGADPIHAFVSVYEAKYKAEFRQQEPNADGFVHRPNINEDITDGADRMAMHEGLVKPKNLEPNLALMIEATKLLHDRGVRVVFVRAPTAPTYRPKPALAASYQAYLDQLLAATKAEYVDFSDLVPTGKQYFRNSDHLQGEGVVIFSRKIAELTHKQQS